MANTELQNRQDNAALVDSLTKKAANHLAEYDTLNALVLAEGRGMTADEQTAATGHLTAAEDINKTLDLNKRRTATNVYSDAPNPARTEVRDNSIDKPWGPEAQSGETKEQRRKRLFMGFGEYLSAVRHAAHAHKSGKDADPRLLALNEGFEKRAQAAGASEQIPSDGSFLISPDMSAELLELAHETGVVYPRATKLPLSEFTNSIKIPAVDEQSRKDGFRNGGVQMFWESEAQAFTGSKPSFALLEMTLAKLTGLYYATNEVLADSRLLGSAVMRYFTQEFGYKLDDAMIRGTGVGQFLGILNANCKATVSVAKETGQAVATVTYENIKKMWSRMWAPCRANSVWFINQDVEPQLFGLSQVVGVGGMPVFLPPGGASALPYSQLFGRPVLPIEQCATVGTVGDIILSDFSQYLMIDKGDLQTATSMHVRFLTDEQTFRWIYRTQGQPWWRTALTPAQGTNTLSPFVTVASR